MFLFDIANFDLASRQRELTEFAAEYYRKKRVPVTPEIIGKHFEVNPGPADGAYRWLKRTGRLFPTPNVGDPGKIENNEKNRTLFNDLALNIPLFTEDDMLAGTMRRADDPRHSMTIPRDGLIFQHALFGFVMNDSNMHGLGIYKGDWLVFAKDIRPGYGDFVLVLYDQQILLMQYFTDEYGRYSLKRLGEEERTFTHQKRSRKPLNLTYRDSCRILGVLQMLTRRFF